MVYNQVCNRHGDKSNRWSLGLSLIACDVRGLKRAVLRYTAVRRAEGPRDAIVSTNPIDTRRRHIPRLT